MCERQCITQGDEGRQRHKNGNTQVKEGREYRKMGKKQNGEEKQEEMEKRRERMCAVIENAVRLTGTSFFVATNLLPSL